MPIPLKQSTAKTLRIGRFIDKTDGVTAITTITSGTMNTNLKLSKDHGAGAARSSAGSITHDLNGWYLVPLDTTDTNTLGRLTVSVYDSTIHIPVDLEFVVMAANVYDSLIAASDALDVSLIQWLGSAPSALSAGRVDATVGALQAAVITAASIAADAITSSKVADGALTAAKFAAGALAGVWDALTANLTTANSIGKRLVDFVTTLVYSAPGAAAPTVTQIRQEMDTNSTKLDAAISTRATPAQVNTEVLDVLVTDTFAEPAAVPAATASLKDKLGFLMLLARNKRVQTATEQTVKADNGTTTVSTSTLTRTASQVDVGEWT